jgi:hypothetical protein
MMPNGNNKNNQPSKSKALNKDTALNSTPRILIGWKRVGVGFYYYSWGTSQSQEDIPGPE